jgi:4-carboxymuconolactone decarboxylase
MTETRMTLVDANRPPDGLKPVFDQVTVHYGRPPGAAHRLLANHPALYRQWLGTGSELLVSGKLPARTRELVILRTARNCKCAYERRSHEAAARDAGVDDAQLAAVQATGLDVRAFDQADLAALRCADRLWADATLDDATWAELRRHFEPPLAEELLFLVGHYVATAFLLNGLGLQEHLA